MASHLAAACFVAVPLPVARRVRGSVRLVAARLATVALAAVHSRLTWLARRLGSSAVQGLTAMSLQPLQPRPVQTRLAWSALRARLA